MARPFFKRSEQCYHVNLPSNKGIRANTIQTIMPERIIEFSVPPGAKAGRADKVFAPSLMISAVLAYSAPLMRGKSPLTVRPSINALR